MTDRAVELHADGSATTSLLGGAAAGNVADWAKLVSLYGPVVFRWCRRWGLQPSDAENVGQEVFLRVAGKLAEFRHDRPQDTFRGWLFRIARNCFVDHLRKQDGAVTGPGGSSAQQRLEQVPADDGPDAEEAKLAAEDAVLLYRRIVEFVRSSFSDRDWTAFYRTVIDGYTPAETAAELAVSVNVVYLARSRVLLRVRQEFAGLLPDHS